MEAIIEMSTIAGQKSWEKADLASKDQLELHVMDLNSLNFQYNFQTNKFYKIVTVYQFIPSFGATSRKHEYIKKFVMVHPNQKNIKSHLYYDSIVNLY